MATIKELWQEASELLGEAEFQRRARSWISGIIRNARLKATKCDIGDLYAQDVESVLADLNMRTRSRFKATDIASHLIVQQLRNGYVVADFLRVNEVKCAQWLGNDKMEYCLRPSTLYRPSHFDEYLAEWWRMEDDRTVRANRRARDQVRQKDAKDADMVQELMKTPWHKHGSFREFLMWTVRFPDQASLDKYEMPAKLRELRGRAGITMNALRGDRLEVEEREYARLRREHGKK